MTRSIISKATKGLVTNLLTNIMADHYREIYQKTRPVEGGIMVAEEDINVVGELIGAGRMATKICDLFGIDALEVYLGAEKIARESMRSEKQEFGSGVPCGCGSNHDVRDFIPSLRAISRDPSPSLAPLPKRGNTHHDA